MSFTPQVKRVSKSSQKNPSVKIAAQLMKENRDDEALSVFEEILEKDPNSKPAHLGIGKICMKQKDYEGALSHFQTVKRIDPTMAKAALAVGNVYYKQNEMDSAIAAFEDAVKIDPSAPSGYLGIGRALLKQKKYPQAKEQVQKALLFNPQLTSGRLLMSQIHQEQGNTEAAIGEIESALKMNPTAWSAYQALGNIYLKQQKYNLARKNFEEAQQLNPKIPVVAKMGYIEALIESNALNQAAEILRDMPNKKPLEAKKQKLWGDLYTRQGYTKEAAEAYRAANLLAAEQGDIANELSTLDLVMEEDEDKLGEILETYKEKASQQIAQTQLRKNP
jgi:tetratricopeptide (TPR) repeat protein